jgi:hypothetical protein
MPRYVLVTERASLIDSGIPNAYESRVPWHAIRRRYSGNEKVSDSNRHSMRLRRKVILLPAPATLLHKDATLAGATSPGIIVPTTIDLLLQETFTFDAKQIATLAFRTSHVTHRTADLPLRNSEAKHFISY